MVPVATNHHIIGKELQISAASQPDADAQFAARFVFACELPLASAIGAAMTILSFPQPNAHRIRAQR